MRELQYQRDPDIALLRHLFCGLPLLQSPHSHFFSSRSLLSLPLVGDLYIHLPAQLLVSLLLLLNWFQLSLIELESHWLSSTGSSLVFIYSLLFCNLGNSSTYLLLCMPRADLQLIYNQNLFSKTQIKGPNRP